MCVCACVSKARFQSCFTHTCTFVSAWMHVCVCAYTLSMLYLLYSFKHLHPHVIVCCTQPHPHPCSPLRTKTVQTRPCITDHEDLHLHAVRHRSCRSTLARRASQIAQICMVHAHPVPPHAHTRKLRHSCFSNTRPSTPIHFPTHTNTRPSTFPHPPAHTRTHTCNHPC
jgi:hypothetical protein